MKICLYDSGLGVVSFLYQAIKHHYDHEYYILIDKENFPYGNKSDQELIKILKTQLEKIEKMDVDYLFICCNTMSRIYHMLHLKTRFKVRTILDINLTHLNQNNFLLATSSIKKYYHEKVVDGKDLASFIEENNIIQIIKFIKKINSNIILSCTHYHLIKPILDYYNIDYHSYENEIFDEINSQDKFEIYIKREDLHLIKKFIKLDIKIY